MNNKLINEFTKLLKQIAFNINTSNTKKEETKHSFRYRQINNVLNIIKKYNKKIKNGNELKDIKGIGKGSINRIDEILKNGFLKEISLNQQDTNNLKQIKELEKVIGIGNKKAIELVLKHNIKSVKSLINAHKNNKIKLNDKILLGLKYINKCKDNIPRKEIIKIDTYLQKIINKTDIELFGIICGSYRRLKPSSGDIDLLIVHPKIKTIQQLNKKKNYLLQLIRKLKQDKFLIDDMTDKNPINKYMGFCKYKKNPVRRIDIRYIPYNSYYSALLYFTGSGNFNKKMRNIAIELGYKLSEYGLFKNNKLIKTNSEKEIFNKLNMKYVKPENRL